MFSLDRFYNILHNNLISHLCNGHSVYHFPFGTYDNIAVLQHGVDISNNGARFWGDEGFYHCYFFDQEPFFDYTKTVLDKSKLSYKHVIKPNRINILAVSEKSNLVSDYALDEGYHLWYYFYHGFAALDWYRDFQYIEPQSFNQFDKVFICYNHLTSKYRSYRLHLVSNLIEKDLIKHGYVSLFYKDTWRETIRDPENLLDNRARVKIYNALKNAEENLIIDKEIPTGSMSANVNFDQLTGALFHIVTETIYFQPKLHLTEKVFKPIVSKRPFFLVAAPGNLSYLKSYGFRTFDRWIDESYDNEQDHYIRIEKITKELAKLCAMDPADLSMIHEEMQEVLEYNFNHFYGNFKHIIIDELVDNFNKIVAIPNAQEIKQRLSR
jgi:hypothetical protein